MVKQIKVMRGISGSGKSTIAKAMADDAIKCGFSPRICSADDFFIDRNGQYQFNPAQLGEAHKECMRQFLQAIQSGMSPIFVDNTNINIEDLSPYVAVGEALGYDVEILQLNTPFELACDRNTHGVPAKTVRYMDQRLSNINLPARFKVKHIPYGT